MDQFVSTEQAAQQIGISTDHLYVWLQRHPEFKPQRTFGKSYMWTQGEINAVIAEREKPGGN